MQPNYSRVGGMDCIFCGKMGMCVRQPWQSIGLWSVADRFLSTFSFILICAPSLSPSHAENEVSRLETALQPTCQILLFSLPIPFSWQTPSLEEEILATRYLHSFRLKTVWLPLFSQITLRAEEKVLCLRASFFFFFFPYGYDNITLCRTCCYYKRPRAVCAWRTARWCRPSSRLPHCTNVSLS